MRPGCPPTPPPSHPQIRWHVRAGENTCEPHGMVVESREGDCVTAAAATTVRMDSVFTLAQSQGCRPCAGQQAPIPGREATPAALQRWMRQPRAWPQGRLPQPAPQQPSPGRPGCAQPLVQPPFPPLNLQGKGWCRGLSCLRRRNSGGRRT